MSKLKQATTLGNSLHNLKIPVPRYVMNPGLYIGAVKGYEAAGDRLKDLMDHRSEWWWKIQPVDGKPGEMKSVYDIAQYIKSVFEE